MNLWLCFIYSCLRQGPQHKQKEYKTYNIEEASHNFEEASLKTTLTKRIQHTYNIEETSYNFEEAFLNSTLTKRIQHTYNIEDASYNFEEASCHPAQAQIIQDI